MKFYAVINGDRTEGFLTTDKQLAYEVRKSASSNCFDENGRSSEVGQAFCERWWEDSCVMIEIDIPVITPSCPTTDPHKAA